jgi:hypothetical protein
MNFESQEGEFLSIFLLFSRLFSLFDSLFSFFLGTPGVSVWASKSQEGEFLEGFLIIFVYLELY